MKKFVLNRKVDVSGMSGTGIVAEGVIFSNGRVVLCWLSALSTIVVHENMENVEKLHCHGGQTIIEFN